MNRLWTVGKRLTQAFKRFVFPFKRKTKSVKRFDKIHKRIEGNVKWFTKKKIVQRIARNVLQLYLINNQIAEIHCSESYLKPLF